DDNKKQLDGPVKGIRAHADLAGKFRAFGWHVQTCRGYDAEDIARAIECAKALRGAPSLIVLDTFKGLGCLDAERAAFNHYMVIDQAMAERAIDEIERRYADGSYPRGDVRW
ncbi:MAG: transketolase, partial [Eubacteriales bacterium]|nr:transketolase [Eubacteriales bacterium]